MVRKPLHDQLINIVTMLVVNDLERSVAFYRNLFGFEVLDSSEHIVLIERNGMLLYLFTHSPPTPDKPTVTLTNLNTSQETPVVIDFYVKDCRAAYEELKLLGVEFLTPPQQPPWGGWRCFARDPDGYLIELEENLDSPIPSRSAR